MLRLTLEEAQAIECNRCGDCCDSRRARRFGNTLWGWGDLAAPPPSIVPLRWAHRDEWEDDRPRSGPHGPASSFFRCLALDPQLDGTALCGLRDDPARPSLCVNYPVWGDHAVAIRAELEAGREFSISTAGPRCAWYGVVVTPARV